MATVSVVGDVIASRPPQASIEDHARRSSVLVDDEKVLAQEKQHTLEQIATDSRDSSHEIRNGPARGAHIDRIAPTEEETKTLRRVPGKLPWIAYVLCVVEFAERGSYYGAAQVFTNFMTYPLPKGGNGAGSPAPPGSGKLSELRPGALGGGTQFANVFYNLFKFLAYALPIFGAWIGDAKIGRYKAIMIGVLICGLSHIIQIFGALPSVLQKGRGAAPFLISLFLLAIGAGIFKPNILPTVLDQYEHHEEYVKVLRSGERVIVSHELTVNRISTVFYGFVNIGAFIGVGTAYAEKFVGFWLAFLIPGIIYFLLPLILMFTKNKTYQPQPNGSELNDFFKIIAMAFRRSKGRFWRNDFLDTAKPSNLAAAGITTFRGKGISWDDRLVEDVRRTLKACQMFLWFPIWYINDNGLGIVANAQAGSMTKGAGGTNDVLGNFNPLTVIVFVPLLTFFIYPTLERFHMMPGRITRITFGFTLAWISGVFGAVLQHIVYTQSPCGNQATECDGVASISVWAQAPVFILGAMSECFCQVTAYEIAYARSPKNMKALVMSIFLFMNALSSIIALVCTPAIKDPNLIWVWAGPAIALFIVSIVFFILYRKMNNDEFMLRHQTDGVVSRAGTEETKKV